MPGRLEGKVALITGGTSGIGRAGAGLFCREGADVIIGALEDDLTEEVVSELQNEGPKEVVFFPTDVSNPKEVEWLV
jgi:NAD(P)-dependent dehydrogenase (short-subunit alcohol dehydrogenase family)